MTQRSNDSLINFKILDGKRLVKENYVRRTPCLAFCIDGIRCVSLLNHFSNDYFSGRGIAYHYENSQVFLQYLHSIHHYILAFDSCAHSIRTLSYLVEYPLSQSTWSVCFETSDTPPLFACLLVAALAPVWRLFGVIASFSWQRFHCCSRQWL